MIFYYDIADLRHFSKTAVGLRSIAKAITADYCACMNRNVVSYFSIVIDFFTGMNDAIVANDRTISYIHVGKYL